LTSRARGMVRRSRAVTSLSLKTANPVTMSRPSADPASRRETGWRSAPPEKVCHAELAVGGSPCVVDISVYGLEVMSAECNHLCRRCTSPS